MDANVLRINNISVLYAYTVKRLLRGHPWAGQKVAS